MTNDAVAGSALRVVPAAPRPPATAGRPLMALAAQHTTAPPHRRLFEVHRCYDLTRVETAAGQYLDVPGETESATWSADRAATDRRA